MKPTIQFDRNSLMASLSEIHFFSQKLGQETEILYLIFTDKNLNSIPRNRGYQGIFFPKKFTGIKIFLEIRKLYWFRPTLIPGRIWYLLYNFKQKNTGKVCLRTHFNPFLPICLIFRKTVTDLFLR